MIENLAWNRHISLTVSQSTGYKSLNTEKKDLEINQLTLEPKYKLGVFKNLALPWVMSKYFWKFLLHSVSSAISFLLSSTKTVS